MVNIFVDDILKRNSLKKFSNLIQISLKFIPKNEIDQYWFQ